ncbi:MAG: hypothetical protein ACLVKM_10015 [Oscillospiraceae bacterium]
MSVQGAARLFSPVRYGIGAISLAESSDFDPIRSWANEQFRMLSADYNAEQKQMAAQTQVS